MEYFPLLFRSRRAFPLVVTIVMAACNVHPPTSAKTTSIPVLNVSCKGQDDALDCRALKQVAASAIDSRESVDVTDAVVWTTSDASTAAVLRGHVWSNEPGSATITATLRAGNETVTASVLVVVGDDGGGPQVAYDLSGVVRDVSNTAIPNAELTLSDGQGGNRIAVVVTGQNGGLSEGTFRFAPVLSGTYRVQATKSGYRPVERVVNVPDTSPLTLVMLSEPR